MSIIPRGQTKHALASLEEYLRVVKDKIFYSKKINKNKIK